MPNTEQAKKRLRQDEGRNLRNRMVKSEIKTLTKRLLKAVSEGDQQQATELLRTTQSRLDMAVRKGTLHKNTVSRRKSLLQRKMAEQS